ncbi:MAG: tetratricopeptide repeat protein [Rhodocyclaceae bacterium]|nr:tetratricopeptide repeat protein [Rhodocyclaceae bacterium]MBX3667734.1 tetratricopeptide repeat protein [Rhodocyclaceae bacterium]
MPGPEALEKLLGGPRDGALLRYSLGNEYFKAGDFARAAQMLASALEKDPNYSAAWKLLGKAQEKAGDPAAALSAFKRGTEVAEARGDIQAAKEMRVFARRLEKAAPESETD